MDKIKCITFDKNAQDNLPQHIKDKMKADRKKVRYSEISICTSPEELALAIWTKELEEAMGDSRDIYRKPFVQWINEYAAGVPHEGWKYDSPRELAEAIWLVFDKEDDYLENLRKLLIKCIENYKSLKNK